MSRSSFAERFRKLVGATPLDHLTEWRMARAANMLLAHCPMKIAAIAAAVGYESESAFGKVFSRVMGMSPGKYRASIQAGVSCVAELREAVALRQTRRQIAHALDTGR